MLLQIQEPSSVSSQKNEKKHAIGIDLGTTHSLVAWVQGEKPVVLCDGGDPLLPSVVAFEDEEIVVGERAKEYLKTKPEIVVSSIKRLMGRGRSEVTHLPNINHYRFASIENHPASNVLRLQINDYQKTPVEISAEILKSLKQRAEMALGEEVTQAVVTVPAYFDETARSATRDAARLAGLDVLRLVNEPTAAALAYGLDKGIEGLYAVYDLGGGTFDFSVLKLHKGVFQVISTIGDMYLGGDDFDQEILNMVWEERQVHYGEEEVPPPLYSYLLSLCRQGKEALSENSFYDLTINVNGQESQHRISRSAFEQRIDAYLQKTILLCRRALEDVQVLPQALEGIVLVGGATRMPLLRQKVKEFFGQAPRTDIDPDQAVAFGAALQADALTGGVTNTLLLDITPLSLGIEIMGGMVDKIIPRHSPIPMMQTQEFTTHQDGQTAMIIHVVQGEREFVKDCHSLAQFILNGIPPLRAGIARVEVIFSLDTDGLLTVKAREKTTGVEQEVAIKPTHGMDRDEFQQLLLESFSHREEDHSKRLLQETILKAETLSRVTQQKLEENSHLLSEEDSSSIKKSLEALAHEVKNAKRRDEILELMNQLDLKTQTFAARCVQQQLKL